MTLEDVLNWLKTLNTRADNYYAGTLPDKKDRSFGVYQLKDNRARSLALGGASCTKTHTKGISVLVHWERSARTTENKARELYNELAALSGAVIAGKYRCSYIALANIEPIDVGADEHGIMERVIEFVIYYEEV